ncbi:MAG: DUF892 family protein [Beijerinckiaceae bacterium]|nr:DUF892 family protein [Beijerinckiaceae bacterium]MCZ8300602.1 DUF892 family protein [Beijerinckiaceae bacterium]
MKTLKDAFEHLLNDVYYAENALVKALPEMAEAAGSAALKSAFRDHLAETKKQIKILKDVFAACGFEVKGEKCDAIEGLIKEGGTILAEGSGIALDASLLALAQAVEHYEIARYGTLREWAKALDLNEPAAMISEILDMEKACNSKLTGIAVAEINKPSRAKAA